MPHLWLFPPTAIELLSRSTMSYSPPDQQCLIFDFSLLLPSGPSLYQQCLILLPTNVLSLTLHFYSHLALLQINSILFSHLWLFPPTPQLLSRSTTSYSPPNQQHLIFDFTLILPSYQPANNISSSTFPSYPHPAPLQINSALFASLPTMPYLWLYTPAPIQLLSFRPAMSHLPLSPHTPFILTNSVSSSTSPSYSHLAPLQINSVLFTSRPATPYLQLYTPAPIQRSEERRVGKEC